MTENTVVERALKAAKLAQQKALAECGNEFCLDDHLEVVVRAVIAALREPTYAMQRAFTEADVFYSPSIFAADWARAIDAALSQQENG